MAHHKTGACRHIAAPTICTLGSSLHPWASFERLLQKAGADMLIDVRSSPRSRLHHFNQGALTCRLEHAGLRYVFLGHQLGGRPQNGIDDYEAMAREPQFIAGIDRVVGLATRFRAVLMCSEHEPLQCHRYLLVGRALAARGFAVRHLLRDGTIEEQRDTDERLLLLHRRVDIDLLTTRETRLDEAYRMQNRRLCGAPGRSKQGGSDDPKL